MISFSLTQLWLNSLLLIPVAIIVLGICRLWPHIRPATRHALWLMTLLLLFIPSARQVFDGLFATTATATTEATTLLDDPPPTDDVLLRDVATLAERQLATTWSAGASADLVETTTLPNIEFDETDHVAIDLDRILDHDDVICLDINDSLIGEELSQHPIEQLVAITAEENKHAAQLAPEADDATSQPALSGHASTLTAWLDGLDAIRLKIIALPPLPAAVWLGGIAILLPILFARMLLFARALRKRLPVDAATQSLIDSAAAQLDMRKVPQSCFLAGARSPLVWCGFHNILVLPTVLWQGLDDTSRRAVVLHELAHLKRRDHWVCRIELLIGIVYWWHPIVWFIRARIRDEADYSCDAWVTELLPDARRSYADALLESRKHPRTDNNGNTTNQHNSLALSLVGPAVGLGASSSRTKAFARRLTMIMTHETRPRISYAGGLLAVLFATGGLAIAPLAACPPECSDAKTAPVEETTPQPSNTFEEYMQNRDAEVSDDVNVEWIVAEPVAVAGEGQFPVAVANSNFARATAPSPPALPTLVTVETGQQQQKELAELRLAYARAAQQSPSDLHDFERRLNRLEQQVDRLVQLMEMQLHHQQQQNERNPFGPANVRQTPPTPPTLPNVDRPDLGPRGVINSQPAEIDAWRELAFVQESSPHGQVRILQLDPHEIEVVGELVGDVDFPALVRIEGDSFLVAGQDAELQQVEALIRAAQQQLHADDSRAIYEEYIAEVAAEQRNAAAMAEARDLASSHEATIRQSKESLHRALRQLEEHRAVLEAQMAELKVALAQAKGEKRALIKQRIEDSEQQYQDVLDAGDGIYRQRELLQQHLRQMRPEATDSSFRKQAPPEDPFDDGFDIDVDVEEQECEQECDEPVEYDRETSELPLAAIR